MTENNTVKIARLETQMSSVEQKVDELKLQIHEVSVKIDNLSLTQAKVKELDNELRDFKIEVRKRNFVKGWLYPTLSAVLSAIITFLIIEYLRRV